jgi:hypothetical protein
MRKLGLKQAAVAALALALGGCGGHDASQVVHKDRSTVYAAFSDAMKESAGETTSDGLSLEVEEHPNDTIDVKLMHKGGAATHAVFSFAKQNGDKDTLVSADIDVDRGVLAEALGPSAKGNGAVAAALSETAFKLGMQRMLKKSAERIESGMPLTMGHSSFSSPEGSNAYANYQSSYEARRQQEAATRPMTDPDQAAQQYLSQSGSSSGYDGSYGN